MKTTKAMMDKALSEALAKANAEREEIAGTLSLCDAARKSLKEQLDEATKRIVLAREEKAASDKIMEQALGRANEADKREKETRAQFADLKSRLFDATKRIEYLTGYLARVQEDDHVREDLIPVGDPEGEQSLVPKRRHKLIVGEDHSEGRDSANALIYQEAKTRYDEPSRSKPRRWINY